MKRQLRKILPPFVFDAYHISLALLGAIIYRFPSQKLFVIGVTGTKGKSTVVELIASILREAGHTVASQSTIRFAIGDDVEKNLYKMTMPGRFFMQRFLRRALNAGATHAVIEMTSEGVKQFRHRGIALDALVFTNIAPEHIEAHGSFEAYLKAKLSIAHQLELSPKRPRYIAANADDMHGEKFLDSMVEKKIPFSLKDVEPYSVDDASVRFVYKNGEVFTVPLPGLFNLYNVLAAIVLCEAMGIPLSTMKRALEHHDPIPGRAERVEKGQPFLVVVDYAHTLESLKALYETYRGHRIIAVMGATGGGRDKWKRVEMGKLADRSTEVTILTNEDPYDEDPAEIVNDLAKGFSLHEPVIQLNRRLAIRKAFSLAKEGDAILITGKGTDPYIMGPSGTKEEWSDTAVAREELERAGYR